METFKYFKVKTTQESPEVFRFYFNINHGEPSNCLIIEIDATNPKFENFSKLDYLKYNKIIQEESAFHMKIDGDLEGMVKILLDDTREVWVREDSIKPII